MIEPPSSTHRTLSTMFGVSATWRTARVSSKPVISGIQRVSRPGQRSYVDHAHIPRIQGGMGTTIISTSKGVMTGHEARQMGVGGEIVAKVW